MTLKEKIAYALGLIILLVGAFAGRDFSDSADVIDGVLMVARALYLRLQEHLEKRENLFAALTCNRAYYRLTMHEAHRPSYPEWVVKPDPNQEEVWSQLNSVVNNRIN